MAWDANRPIPWQRLLREASIFIVIGAVAIMFLVNDPKPGDFLGLVIGMTFYVGFVAVLSKFGYQRQSMREARERRRAAVVTQSVVSQTARQRPAPTKRTSTGPSQRPNRSTKKRRR